MFARRFRRALGTAMLLASVSAAVCHAAGLGLAAPVPVRTIAGLGKGAAVLDLPWQFHAGDDASWARPELDDSGWEQLRGDQPWGRQGHANYTGYAWYRLRLRIEPSPGALTQIALLMPQVDDIYQLFWNGVEIGHRGKMPPYPVWYDASAPGKMYDLGPLDSESGLTGVLAVRVWKSPPLSDDSGQSGGFEAAPMVGTREALAAHQAALDYAWLEGHQFSLNEYLLYAVVGLLSLLGWLRDRRQWLLFWMTGFALAPLVRLLLYGLRIAWPVTLAYGLGEPFSSVRDISLWYLLLWLLHLRDSRRLMRLTRLFAFVSVAANVSDGLLSAVDASADGFWLVQIADAAFTVVYFVTAALPLVLVAVAVTRRRRLDLARWLVSIAAVLSGMLQVVQGMAPQGRRFTHWTLADRIAAPLFSFHGNGVSLPTLTGTLLLVAIVYAVYCSSMENRRRQSVLEQELRSARELQQVLIPETLPAVPGFTLTSAYRPAQEVGGDFFQMIPLEANATLVIVGDVSGKGLKAAMAVSLIVGLIRALADGTGRQLGPAELLREVNRRLHGRLQGGFTTCIALHVQADGHCVVASAGHPAPYVNEREMELEGSFPLGIVASVSYPETAFQLRVGDHLALYTDGLPEARNGSGELYGFDRLEKLFVARPDAAQVTEAAVEFGQDDDITVVILRHVAGGQEAAPLHTGPRST